MEEVPYALIRLYISVRNGEISARSTERSRELIPETTGSMLERTNGVTCMGATTPTDPWDASPTTFENLGYPTTFANGCRFLLGSMLYSGQQMCIVDCIAKFRTTKRP